LEFERGRVERDEETIRTLNACWAAAQAEAAKLREQANELIEALAHDHQGGPPCFIGCDSCQLVADMAIALAAPLPAPTPRALSPDAADHGDGK
jgi:hypothetical protein